MSTGREEFQKSLRGRLDLTVVGGVMDTLGELFTAAETGQVRLAPKDKVDTEALLGAAKDVLQDDEPGGINKFRVTSVKLVRIWEAGHLRSKSIGAIRPTDWPPSGISSFGVSVLLYLRYSPDMRDNLFQSVHNLVHVTLLRDLRKACLPDGGQLGGTWIVPWTIVSDSVLFLVTHTLLGLDEAAGNLERFVRFMPGVLPIGFTCDAGGNTSGELVVIAG
ncbi:MAG: hypothetical protein U9Q03_04685 [Patescibacteria group bacterium]|nr:hypothetical protein [Patescibacteria group bacterium]